MPPKKKFCCRKCLNTHFNKIHMSKDAQKDRGRMRKTKLVNIKGGKCEKCGYDRNYAALSFHHRDSSLKKFTLDLQNITNRKWERILEELAKCDLLCMNCHFSLHNPTQKFE
jgi:hypothetical protein